MSSEHVRNQIGCVLGGTSEFHQNLIGSSPKACPIKFLIYCCLGRFWRETAGIPRAFCEKCGGIREICGSFWGLYWCPVKLVPKVDSLVRPLPSLTLVFALFSCAMPGSRQPLASDKGTLYWPAVHGQGKTMLCTRLTCVSIQVQCPLSGPNCKSFPIKNAFRVCCRAGKGAKLPHNEKYSSERGAFFGFNCYLCPVCRWVCCLILQH